MPARAIFLASDEPAWRTRLEEYNAIARQLGGAVEFVHVDPAHSDAEIIKQGEGAIALTVGHLRHAIRDRLPGIVRQLPQLKLVQAPSAGTDVFDKIALAKLGVQVCNAGGANAVAVAEHTIAFMFALYRKFALQLEAVKAGQWQAPVVAFPETEFHTFVGKRIGLVGLGRIGSRVAKRLQGWECEVVYHEVVDLPKDYVEATGARRVDFQTLLQTSDVVSMHVPLEPTTRHMMSDRQFAMMKPTALYISTCRGPVTDEAALIRALNAKAIFGAGLDVVESEPIGADNPLPRMENVLVTPHLATRSIQSTINSRNFVVANITRLAKGEPIESVVPPVQE